MATSGRKGLNEIIKSRGNQSYILASAPTYDEWIRTDYELQVWKNYLKLGTESNHWAKEVIQRTKRRDDIENTRFVRKKINQLDFKITQASVQIADLQLKLGNYWTMVPGRKHLKRVEAPIHNIMTTTITTTATTNNPVGQSTTNATSNTESIRDEIKKLEKLITDYIKENLQNVKKMAETRVHLAKSQMDEYKALQSFLSEASPQQVNSHLLLKSKMKSWNTKNKNYQIALKRSEYNLPPKFINNVELNFKIDESIMNHDEVQRTYDKMRKITDTFRVDAMTLYVENAAREFESVNDEVSQIIKGFPGNEDINAVSDRYVDQDMDENSSSFTAFKYYHELRLKRLNIEVNQSCYFLEEQRVEGEIDKLLEVNQEFAPTHIRSLDTELSLQI